MFYRLSLVFACMISPVRAADLTGLKRTDFSDWRIHRFEKVGFQIELPAGVKKSESKNIGAGLLLHYFQPSVFYEGTYFLTVEVSRRNPAELFTNVSAEKVIKRNKEAGIPISKGWVDFVVWQSRKHPTTEYREDHDGWVVFLRDVECPNKEVLRGKAKLAKRLVPQYWKEDEAAIRRMLDSIKPLW